jgi:hypothetical protein
MKVNKSKMIALINHLRRERDSYALNEEYSMESYLTEIINKILDVIEE